jgi:3-isopropylmalate/(R)-2-methylmalate dehydratase small subunit
MSTLRGYAHKYGANVNTDVLIPARYLNANDRTFWLQHALEDLDSEFRKRVKPGDIVVATTNFGCGSSREQAPIVIKDSGVSAVIASSFARIFFRNAINIGLPLLESPEAAEDIEMGDELEVDPSSGVIVNLTKGRNYHATPYPEFMQSMVTGGGILPYAKQRLAELKAQETGRK